MDDKQLVTAMQQLTWSEDELRNVYWPKEALDEKALLGTLKAIVLRFQHEVQHAKSTLEKSVLNLDNASIKACEHADTWPLPVAHYEMAVLLWQEAGREDGDKKTLQSSSEWLAKVEKWETYDLETRIGLKITTARDTLKKCGIVST